MKEAKIAAKEAIDLPEEMENIMVTFIGKVLVRDKYYDHYENHTITRRGFYSKSKGYYNPRDQWISTPNGYVSVPPSWKIFNDILLPHGWVGYRVLPEEIIKWEYVKEP